MVSAVPSPHLENGGLSPSAQRGKELFFRADVRCAECHPAPLYSDLQCYNVGTRGALDRRDAFDTPTLVELWRTAPYLHDGRSATLTDVFTEQNAKDQHGVTSGLSEQELRDLVEFLLSL